MVSLRYLSGRIKNGLFKRWGRLLVLSIVPITMITFVGNLFGTVTQNALKPVMNKIILTELEGAKRGTDKISINTDDEDNFMLENQAYNQEIFDDLTVKFVADYNEAGKPIYEEVSLVDLYESVGYNSWVGKAEYLADESSFSGFKEDVSTLWYNTNEFIPVHYSKYSTSVFYYFYDWIKSSYLRYYQIYNNENLSDYSTEVFNGLASTVKPNISYEDYIDVPVDEDELVTSEEDGVVYTPDIEEEIKKSYIDMPKTVDVEDFIADKEALRKALEAALVPLDSIDDLETMELQNKSLSETKQTNYKNTIREGEETFMYFVDGIYNMYTDTDYTTVGDSRSDLFGLSYLFNMTGDDGLPLETYSNNVSIEDWALREYTAGLDRLSDFGKHALRLDETVDTITDETVIEVGKDEIDNAITVSPIAAIIQSPYWREYKNSSYLYNGGKKSNMMQEYLFTPDYIQKNEHGDMTVDFSTGWTETKPVLTEEENTRIPWRLYASRGLLVEDVGLDNSAHSTPSLLENRLMQLNDKIYRSIMNLQDVYKDSHISDDTMIFVSALIATFEFNNTFGGDTVSIELDDISTDKLFRVIYASSIKDVIENPNLVYMLYEQGGILSSIGLAITEFLFITMMYLRCVLYLVLMIACIVVCFNEWFFKTEDLRQVLKGILMQLGMLIVGQAVIILMLRLGLGVFRLVDSKVLVFLITFIYAVVCFALLKWHWAMFKSLVKNMSSFGYAAIKGEVLGLRNTVSNTVNSMKRARVNSGYGSGRMHNSESYSDNDIIDEDVLQRRISNGNKLSDDDD